MLDSVITIGFKLGTYFIFIYMKGNFICEICVILVCVTIATLPLIVVFHYGNFLSKMALLQELFNNLLD